MRNFLFLSVAALLIAGTIHSFCYSQSPTEQISIITYYPTPYGAYKMLQLYPNPDLPNAGSECDKPGEMLYHSASNTILYCDGQTNNWTAIGFWQRTSAVNKTILPVDGIDKVGIGTGDGEPGTRLEVHGGGGSYEDGRIFVTGNSLITQRQSQLALGSENVDTDMVYDIPSGKDYPYWAIVHQSDGTDIEPKRHYVAFHFWDNRIAYESLKLFKGGLMLPDRRYNYYIEPQMTATGANLPVKAPAGTIRINSRLGGNNIRIQVSDGRYWWNVKLESCTVTNSCRASIPNAAEDVATTYVPE